MTHLELVIVQKNEKILRVKCDFSDFLDRSKIPVLITVELAAAMFGPTPKVTLGLEFFINKAPMSSKSLNSVSIFVWWFRAAKVGWKLVTFDDDEFTNKGLFDPLGNSVLIMVALGGGAGVVLVQVAGL